MKITVSTLVTAPLQLVWQAYTTPADIVQWNTASPDWHTTTAQVDLREGGAFSSRMEAKDGSMGFDFAGVYTKVEPQRCIEYAFGDRAGTVEFKQSEGGVTVTVTFDAEQTHSEEQQRGGWQAAFIQGAENDVVEVGLFELLGGQIDRDMQVGQPVVQPCLGLDARST